MRMEAHQKKSSDQARIGAVREVERLFSVMAASRNGDISTGRKLVHFYIRRVVEAGNEQYVVEALAQQAQSYLKGFRRIE
jgi:hypothetical protein